MLEIDEGEEMSLLQDQVKARNELLAQALQLDLDSEGSRNAVLRAALAYRDITVKRLINEPSKPGPVREMEQYGAEGPESQIPDLSGLIR